VFNCGLSILNKRVHCSNCMVISVIVVFGRCCVSCRAGTVSGVIGSVSARMAARVTRSPAVVTVRRECVVSSVRTAVQQVCTINQLVLSRLSRPPNLYVCLYHLIIVQPPHSNRSSLLVTFARPPTSSSLWITDRSFRCASRTLPLEPAFSFTLSTLFHLWVYVIQLSRVV